MVIKELLVFFILASFPLLGSDGSSSSKEISAQEAIQNLKIKLFTHAEAEEIKPAFARISTFLLSLGNGKLLTRELLPTVKTMISNPNRYSSLESAINQAIVNILTDKAVDLYIFNVYIRQTEYTIQTSEIATIIKSLIVQDAHKNLIPPKEKTNKTKSVDRK